MDVAKGAGVERIGIISESMLEEAAGAAEGSNPRAGSSNTSATEGLECGAFLLCPSGT